MKISTTAIALALLAAAKISHAVDVSDVDVDSSMYKILVDAERAGIPHHHPGKTKGQIALQPSFVHKIKSDAALNGATSDGIFFDGSIITPMTSMTETSKAHVDTTLQYENRPGVPTDDKVGFLFLNTNDDAHFEVDDTCIPARKNRLVTFNGAKSIHQTIIERGRVNLLGPFHIKTFVGVGEAPCDYYSGFECCRFGGCGIGENSINYGTGCGQSGECCTGCAVNDCESQGGTCCSSSQFCSFRIQANDCSICCRSCASNDCESQGGTCCSGFCSSDTMSGATGCADGESCCNTATGGKCRSCARECETDDDGTGCTYDMPVGPPEHAQAKRRGGPRRLEDDCVHQCKSSPAPDFPVTFQQGQGRGGKPLTMNDGSNSCKNKLPPSACHNHHGDPLCGQGELSHCKTCQGPMYTFCIDEDTTCCELMYTPNECPGPDAMDDEPFDGSNYANPNEGCFFCGGVCMTGVCCEPIGNEGLCNSLENCYWNRSCPGGPKCLASTMTCGFTYQVSF